MEKYYFHITKFENLNSILKKGLKANEDGEIFIFNNVSFKVPELSDVINKVADHIATNQIFIKEYILIRISSKGIVSELINDNVAELTSQWQWIVKQPLIEPKYLKIKGFYLANWKL